MQPTILHKVTSRPLHPPYAQLLVLRCLPPRHGQPRTSSGKRLDEGGRIERSTSPERAAQSLIRNVVVLAYPARFAVTRLSVRDGTCVPRASPWAGLLQPLRGKVQNSVTPKCAANDRRYHALHRPTVKLDAQIRRLALPLAFTPGSSFFSKVVQSLLDGADHRPSERKNETHRHRNNRPEW